MRLVFLCCFTNGRSIIRSTRLLQTDKLSFQKIGTDKKSLRLFIFMKIVDEIIFNSEKKSQRLLMRRLNYYIRSMAGNYKFLWSRYAEPVSHLQNSREIIEFAKALRVLLLYRSNRELSFRYTYYYTQVHNFFTIAEVLKKG